jgi:hypothetical protein
MAGAVYLDAYKNGSRKQKKSKIETIVVYFNFLWYGSMLFVRNVVQYVLSPYKS